MSNKWTWVHHMSYVYFKEVGDAEYLLIARTWYIGNVFRLHSYFLHKETFDLTNYSCVQWMGVSIGDFCLRKGLSNGYFTNQGRRCT